MPLKRRRTLAPIAAMATLLALCTTCAEPPLLEGVVTPSDGTGQDLSGRLSDVWSDDIAVQDSGTTDSGPTDTGLIDTALIDTALPDAADTSFEDSGAVDQVSPTVDVLDNAETTAPDDALSVDADASPCLGPGCACVDSGPCDDGDACTVGDGCIAGVCVAGPAMDCGDGNACTADSCADGNCDHLAADGLPCEDGDLCTKGDACAAEQCVAGPPPACDPVGPCEQGQCAPESGLCVQVPKVDGAACDDEDACTDADACKGGICAGDAVSCDDGKACTQDLCAAKSGCSHPAAAGPCDDNNACTADDACANGACAGQVVACGDANPCTVDACDMALGCTHTAAPGPCDDGSACTVDDACKAGLCQGTAKSCDDDDPCTADSCNPATGCQHAGGAATAGWTCDDDDPCTLKDVCNAEKGGCAGSPLNCDSGTPCQVGACDPQGGGCAFTHVDGAACDLDGDKCSLDQCNGGKCAAGKPKACQTGNVCIAAKCAPQTGKCVFSLLDDVPCSDGDACTGPDACDSGNCMAAQTGACKDDNPCTDDACDPATGKCSHPLSKDGQACDVIPCTLGETCAKGSCQGGKPKGCDDGDACTIDSCAPVTGKCQHVIDAEVPACCNQVAWEEDFELPLQGWKFGLPAKGLVWHRHAFPGPGWATAGKSALRLGPVDKDVFSNLGAGADPVQVDSAPISLPAGKPATLRMNVVFDVAGGVTARHRLYVWALVGGRKHLLGRPCQQDGACRPFERDIGALAGRTFRLRIEGVILGSDNNPASGVGLVVDQLRIVTSCKPAPCTLDSGCADVGCISGHCNAGNCAWTDGCCSEDADCTAGLCQDVSCSDGACAFTAQPGCCAGAGDCDDGNPCTTDACPAPGGACSHKAIDGCCLSDASCDDGDSCTKEYCKASKCVSEAHCCQKTSDCDDGDPCTKDGCPVGICYHIPINAPGCCTPELFHWSFDSASQSQGFVMQSCQPGGPQLGPQGCKTSAMEPGRGWQIWTNPPAALATSGVLYYGDSKTADFDYGASAGMVLTPPMKAPARGKLTLGYRTRWQHEVTPYRDRSRVLLYVDGKRQSVPPNISPRAGALWYSGSPGNGVPGVWTQVQHDMTHLRGHTIQLAFTFDSVDGADNGGMGWMVDDLKLTVSCP